MTVTGTSGSATFDEALALLAEHRVDDALDCFELTTSETGDAAVRASAAAHVAGLLLARGEAAEARYWVGIVREHAPAAGLAALLDAAALAQQERFDEVLAVAADAGEPRDPWFACSPHAIRIVAAHARYRLGDSEAARAEIEAVLREAPAATDAWEAAARLAADGALDPVALVAGLDRTDVAAALAGLAAAVDAGGADAAGVDRIAEALWAAEPGDPRVVAAATVFAPHLPLARAAEWAVRIRAAGHAEACPLVARSGDRRVDPAERVRAALAAAAFGDDPRLRDAVEAAMPFVTDRQVADLLAEALAHAPVLADSVVVAGAATTERGLHLARVLCEAGHTAEAYAVLVHALGLEQADRMSAAGIAALLPASVRDALRDQASGSGDREVAALLERLEAER